MNKTEEYLATARKWRPLKFKDIMGQDHAAVTLQNAIKAGKISHAYLFSGPRGVGKTTAARIYARAVNCYEPEGAEPCNKCESCETILEGKSLDVIEIDGASNNSVDDVRKLRENAKYPPSTSKYKIYIIDEVHMLSSSAFNALLKTLEEPPPHLLFVFATTEPQKVLPTILSRCQRFDFRRIEIDDIIKQLRTIAEKEQVKIDEESLVAIAKKADGSMRDAQSMFDQAAAFCGNTINYSNLADALRLIDQDFFFKITKTISNGELENVFDISSAVIEKGYDLRECLGGLLEHFRNILTIKVTSSSDLVETSAAFLEKYKEEAEKFNKSDLLRLMNVTANAEQAIRFAPNPRVRFELTLLQLATMDSVVDIKTLIKEIEELKKKPLTSGTPKAEPKREESASRPATSPTPKKAPAPEPPKPVEKENPASKESPKRELGKKADLSAEALKSGWDDYLENYADAKRGLFILKQSDTVTTKFYNGEIVLQTDKFFKENLGNKIIELKDTLKEHYGAPVSVKIIEENSDGEVKRNNHDGSNKENQTITSNKKSEANEESNKSPIEKAIEDLFGANRVETKQIDENEK